MPLEEFFGDLVQSGGEGGRWKSWWSILGLLVGIGAGIWISVSFGEGTVLAAIGSAATGGLIGWVTAMFLRGFLGFLVIFAIVLAVMFGWEWLTGALG